jgi:4-alpha-methyl-delta7-sterol-4alpha-methyl oxidase
MDPRLAFALVASLLHTLTFLFTWGAFSWMFRRGIARGAQVAAGKAPDPALSRNAVREVLLGHGLFPLLCYALVYPAWHAAGGRVDTTLPALGTFCVQLLAFIALEDTIFYWSHRLLHTRVLFRQVHSRHHRFRYVRGPVAEYAHPLENAMNFVALFVGPVLFGSGFITVCVWIVVRMLETVEAHSGYALTGVSDRHSYHHLYAQRGCYGSFLSPWDWLMGTDRKWRQWRKTRALPE